MRKLAIAMALLVLFGACYGSDDDRGGPEGAPDFKRGTVLIETGDKSVLMHVLVAENDEEHEYGLMNRTSLPQDEGMVFLFFEPRTAGFWMKDTLIPLSIAFFDVDGRILEILDMEPCPPPTTPCRIYEPGVTYRGALEVNQGAFDRLGVSEGDVLEVVPGSE